MLTGVFGFWSFICTTFSSRRFRFSRLSFSVCSSLNRLLKPSTCCLYVSIFPCNPGEP